MLMCTAIQIQTRQLKNNMKMLDETGLDKTINVGYYYYAEKLRIFLIAF